MDKQAALITDLPSTVVAADTETTGLSDGHRVIEVGLVKIINRKITHHKFQAYFNPERAIDDGAAQVHGITTAFLNDKPLFKESINKIKAFIGDTPLVFHNAVFDTGFLSNEFTLAGTSWDCVLPNNKVIDTLKIARRIYPGARHSLDALCDRLEINRANRTRHGALLDAEILAKVYLAMTSGQQGLQLNNTPVIPSSVNQNSHDASPFFIGRANDNELSKHLIFLNNLKIDPSKQW